MDENKEKMMVDGLHTSGIREIDISYPSNSHKSRNIDKKEKPKPQKIVKNGVVQKKKTLGKKLAESFLGDDTKSVGQYMIYDVLIPAAKSTISDMVSGGMERLLFGEVRSDKSHRGKNKSYVSYASYYNNRDRETSSSQRSRNRYAFDDIILKSRGEAEEVISMLVDYIEDYGQATVGDLYDLVGVTSQFTDQKYGWENLSDAGVSRVRDGYLLDLPKPKLLD